MKMCRLFFLVVAALTTLEVRSSCDDLCQTQCIADQNSSECQQWKTSAGFVSSGQYTENMAIPSNQISSGSPVVIQSSGSIKSKIVGMGSMELEISLEDPSVSNIGSTNVYNKNLAAAYAQLADSQEGTGRVDISANCDEVVDLDPSSEPIEGCWISRSTDSSGFFLIQKVAFNISRYRGPDMTLRITQESPAGTPLFPLKTDWSVGISGPISQVQTHMVPLIFEFDLNSMMSAASIEISDRPVIHSEANTYELSIFPDI